MTEEDKERRARYDRIASMRKSLQHLYKVYRQTGENINRIEKLHAELQAELRQDINKGDGYGEDE